MEDLGFGERRGNAKIINKQKNKEGLEEKIKNISQMNNIIFINYIIVHYNTLHGYSTNCKK